MAIFPTVIKHLWMCWHLHTINPGILENPGKSVLGEWDTWVSDLVFLTCLSPCGLQCTIKAYIERLGDVWRVRWEAVEMSLVVSAKLWHIPPNQCGSYVHWQEEQAGVLWHVLRSVWLTNHKITLLKSNHLVTCQSMHHQHTPALGSFWTFHQ